GWAAGADHPRAARAGPGRRSGCDHGGARRRGQTGHRHARGAGASPSPPRIGVRVKGAGALALLVAALWPVVAPAQEGGEDGQWTMPARDYAATRYSPLAQISVANAGRLRPVWTFSTGVLGGHEGQPLVVGHTLYVVTPYP